MPRKFFKKYLPSNESLREHRFLKLFGTLLHHPNLWHLNRHSVAGGVAVGLFTGLIPGPVQALFASIFAIFFRVNLPVAALTTFYTNPFTLVPLYLLAFKMGALVTDGHTRPLHMSELDLSEKPLAEWLPALWAWMETLGKPLFVGLPILASLLAFLGYFAVHLGWRLHTVHAWKQRAARRKEETKHGA